MLTPEELEIAKRAKELGKTPDEALAGIAKYRASKTQSVSTFVEQQEKKPLSNRIADTLGLGGATKTFGKVLNQFGAYVPEGVDKKYVDKASLGEVAGAVAQTGSVIGGLAFGGPATLAGKAALGAGLGYLYDVGQDLTEKKSAGEVLTPGMGTVVGAAAPVVLKGLSAGVGALKKPAEKVATTVGKTVSETIPDSTVVQGTKQKATELVERVPRFVSRVSEATAEQAAKAEKIRTATPQVAQALKVNLPEKYVNTVTQADPATKAAYKRVLDIADETPTTVGVKKNPTIVGGELAGKQYDIIDKQRQKIGKMIGDEVEKLGKSNVKANMGVAFNQVDDVLKQNAIKVGKDGTLSSLRFTDKEMAVIQDLYNKAHKGGDVLTAREVRDMDNLFSKMQREARVEGIGDLRVKVNGEDHNLFRVFRDIYTNQLENIAPEIRPLNAQYRNLITLTDDIEDSIIKTPNFNVTKHTDPAEFAKVNLRRIFGEAQSSPAYEAIADEMDAVSRKLGYTDAKPKDIAAFAQEIRELYPESVPRAGFSGGIKSGIADILQSVSQAGKADVEDQRKALRALLEATEQASK